MLEQDTDRHVSPSQFAYWRSRLPTSPGMQRLCPREKRRIREAAIQRRIERLREREAELRRREDEIRQREAALAPEPAAKPQPKVIEIARLCAEGARMGMAELLSPRRARRLVRARQVAMWLARKHTSRSLPEIGRVIGRRDHSTVMHGIGRTDELLAAGDDHTRALIAYVEARL